MTDVSGSLDRRGEVSILTLFQFINTGRKTVFNKQQQQKKINPQLSGKKKPSKLWKTLCEVSGNEADDGQAATTIAIL